jgi:hypothetical protein
MVEKNVSILAAENKVRMFFTMFFFKLGSPQPHSSLSGVINQNNTKRKCHVPDSETYSKPDAPCFRNASDCTKRTPHTRNYQKSNYNDVRYHDQLPGAHSLYARPAPIVSFSHILGISVHPPVLLTQDHAHRTYAPSCYMFSIFCNLGHR